MTTSFASRLARGFTALLLLALTACSASEPAGGRAPADVKPLNVDLHRDHGFAALRADRHEEAASYFQRILKEQPEDSEARLGLGEAYLGQGRFGDALAQFETVAERSGAALQSKALQGQGIVRLKQGDDQTARTLIEQALEQDAGLWRSWNALGRIKDAEQDHAGARRAYRKAITLNPKSAILHNNLGFSFLASGEPAYAEISLNRALELDPGLGAAGTNLRLALALQGRYEPALAVAKASDRAVALNNVGYAALLRGDREKARSLFLDAMAAAPSFFGEASRNLAFLETLESEQTVSP